MTTKVREPKLNIDGTKVQVRIDIDGHWFMAAFVRLPDGTLSDPAMHVGGRYRSELEQRFWEEARRVRREKESEILALLGNAPDRPLKFELPGVGVVEVTGQTEQQESPRVTEYHVKLNGIRGRVLISERPNGPTRAPSAQGWRELGDATIPLEAQDAIAAELIKRDWGGFD